MDIEQVRKVKDELQSKIEDLILEYQKQTGTKVKDIKISFIDLSSYESIISHINVIVEL